MSGNKMREEPSRGGSRAMKSEKYEGGRKIANLPFRQLSSLRADASFFIRRTHAFHMLI